MKKAFLILSVFALLFCACNGESSSSSTSATSANSDTTITSISKNDNTTKVDLNLSNFGRYIRCTKKEGYTGAAGYSPYEAWLEFKGLLTIGVYDVTVTYTIDSTSHDFKLDASGSGKTDYFDRNASYEITKVLGSVSYLEPNTEVDLDLSNLNTYITYTKDEGYTGAAGYSPYEAWLEFSGVLTIGVYDVTITYVINGTPHGFKLDVSGGGKTDYFDRSASYEITGVSGSVKFTV